jgi:hypothetical protein
VHKFNHNSKLQPTELDQETGHLKVSYLKVDKHRQSQIVDSTTVERSHRITSGTSWNKAGINEDCPTTTAP